MMILMPFMPDSPVWLLHNRREARSMEAMERLHRDFTIRSVRCSIINDIVLKIINATCSKEFNETRENQEYRGTSLKEELLSQKSLHPLLLTLAVQFLQQWCGMNVLIFKTVAVFHEIGWRNIVQLDTIILGVVHLLTVLCE